MQLFIKLCDELAMYKLLHHTTAGMAGRGMAGNVCHALCGNSCDFMANIVYVWLSIWLIRINMLFFGTRWYNIRYCACLLVNKGFVNQYITNKITTNYWLSLVIHFIHARWRKWVCTRLTLSLIIQQLCNVLFSTIEIITNYSMAFQFHRIRESIHLRKKW